MKCFVIAEFGKTEAEHERARLVLKEVIRGALEPLGYEVRRGDEIAMPGDIVRQVMRRIIGDELVVADLTRPNPNVYFELAVRYTLRKPLVQLADKDVELPFDVRNTRTILMRADSKEGRQAARRELAVQARAVGEHSDDDDWLVPLSNDQLADVLSKLGPLIWPQKFEPVSTQFLEDIKRDVQKVRDALREDPGNRLKALKASIQSEIENLTLPKG